MGRVVAASLLALSLLAAPLAEAAKPAGAGRVARVLKARPTRALGTAAVVCLLATGCGGKGGAVPNPQPGPAPTPPASAIVVDTPTTPAIPHPSPGPAPTPIPRF